MEFKDYLPLRGLEHSEDRIRERSIPFYEDTLGMKFGEQLRYYLLNFGYLHYRNVEMLGIERTVGVESDMVRVTKALRRRHPAVNSMVAIERFEGGEFFLVDSEDNVWRYVVRYEELTEVGMKLDDYILSRVY